MNIRRKLATSKPKAIVTPIKLHDMLLLIIDNEIYQAVEMEDAECEDCDIDEDKCTSTLRRGFSCDDNGEYVLKNITSKFNIIPQG